MVQTLRAFLEFCYIARRNIIDSTSLGELEDALERFHRYRVIFQECGVRIDGFALPRQHSLMHYFSLIRAFGAPNGLCSSITESKHIKAVKEPWRRSSRFEALSQMLTTNQRLDKLAAAQADFANRGMLEGTCLSAVLAELSESQQSHMYFRTDTYICSAHQFLGSDEDEPEISDNGKDDKDDDGDGDGNGNVDGNGDGDDDDDDENGAVSGPNVLASVHLASTVGELQLFCIICIGNLYS